jgi:DNA-binding NarL/FixJ family response regulator
MKPKHSPTECVEPACLRLLIIDDHPFLRLGLTEALARESGLCVCGAVASAEEALAAIDKLQPDLVITDLNLPGKSGLELVKDLAATQPALAVIVLSMHDEEIYAERCLRAGARGYVMKSEGTEKLILAIRRVSSGDLYLSPQISARLLSKMVRHPPAKGDRPLSQLSDREFEIFEHIGKGCSTQEISERLQISVKTVETHRSHIKEKLGVKTAGELVVYAANWRATGK